MHQSNKIDSLWENPTDRRIQKQIPSQ